MTLSFMAAKLLMMCHEIAHMGDNITRPYEVPDELLEAMEAVRVAQVKIYEMAKGESK